VTQPEDPRRVKVIVELIDHSTRIAELYDRGDLCARLAAARQRITDPQLRVVIAGQLKQGKSQLLNSLLNLPVARVDPAEAAPPSGDAVPVSASRPLPAPRPPFFSFCRA